MTLVGAARPSSVPRRPVLRWHGGKWRLAPWIIAHLPPHRVYVEPFGGAASVLIRNRANSNRSHTTPAMDWASYPSGLPSLVARLVGVTIEHRPALQVMRAHDAATTLHYVDPPYLHALRAPGNGYDLRYRMYRHEMSDDDHVELLAGVRALKGMVVLSGYPSVFYDEALGGWERVACKAFADGARERTEVLWLNPAAAAALSAARMPLFLEAAE